MSVNCPHCGGEFNVEVRLFTDDVQPRAPQPAEEPFPPPMFRMDTLTGKFRQALWDAGYFYVAKHGTIFNDYSPGGKNTPPSRRLKLDYAHEEYPLDMERLQPFLEEQFGQALVRHAPYRGGHVVKLSVSF